MVRFWTEGAQVELQAFQVPTSQTYEKHGKELQLRVNGSRNRLAQKLSATTVLPGS